ncbi:hypothetical protein ACROYT_G024124 [Oculina patagonica]
MAKLQVAFWLLVAFTVMLKVEGGDLYRRMGFFDEPLFDDADRLKDVYNSELSSEGCEHAESVKPERKTIKKTGDIFHAFVVLAVHFLLLNSGVRISLRDTCKAERPKYNPVNPTEWSID